MDNLSREIKEETGLTIKPIPSLVAAQDILRVPGKHVVRLTYIAQMESGEIVLDEESTEYSWFTLDEIKKLEHLDIYFKEILDRV